jgi:hypothetical protein
MRGSPADGDPIAVPGINRYFQFYNYERPHQSLEYRTPAALYYYCVTKLLRTRLLLLLSVFA